MFKGSKTYPPTSVQLWTGGLDWGQAFLGCGFEDGEISNSIGKVKSKLYLVNNGNSWFIKVLVKSRF